MENVVERGMMLSTGDLFQLGKWFAQTVEATQNHRLDSLNKIQKDHIRLVLKETDGKISGKNSASEILGLKPTTLRSRMEKLGIKIGKKVDDIS
ncbi:MAG: hypothetical protein GY866_33985 [Proteobacteria bacterium]|nr:hypothetical protein [Pseudomonadota bacterium]